ncbi:hypothetical protein O3P69_020645 [Scylla paramamosain]|uniref:Uncharacterized protein n=1 Tax=Scylla paramamosain TaxID=85552 RepID=A0AAW0TM66_SCYPA
MGTRKDVSETQIEVEWCVPNDRLRLDQDGHRTNEELGRQKRSDVAAVLPMHCHTCLFCCGGSLQCSNGVRVTLVDVVLEGPQRKKSGGFRSIK